jgi:hypothetical protein
MAAKCGHDACKCNDSSQAGYCSQACNEGTMNGDRCACGHPDCV